MSDEIDVFAICDCESIAPGGAAAFRFDRINDAGEREPFRIVVVNRKEGGPVGYINECPHKNVVLDGNGRLLSQDKKNIECGQHGALFDIDSGLCTDGPCKNELLEPVAVTVIDGDICIVGVKLLEDDGYRDPFTEEQLEDGPVVLIEPD